MLIFACFKKAMFCLVLFTNENWGGEKLLRPNVRDNKFAKCLLVKREVLLYYLVLSFLFIYVPESAF